MKATVETVKTSTYSLSVEDIQKAVAKDIYHNYGVEVKWQNIQFDINSDKLDSFGYDLPACLVGAVYVEQTRT